jgi:hypothetical protein
MAMGGIVDRHRRLEGVTGLALAGDAWACTNPSQGRGMALALLHVSRLRDAVREHIGDPRGFAAAWDAITTAELEPFYRETVEQDRDRLREMEALRDGRHYVRAPGSTGARLQALGRAAVVDPDAFRALVATRSCVALFKDVSDDRLLAQFQDGDDPPPVGPDRAQLLALLAGGVAQEGEAAPQGA